jgi:Glycosyl hydrolase family 26
MKAANDNMKRRHSRYRYANRSSRVPWSCVVIFVLLITASLGVQRLPASASSSDTRTLSGMTWESGVSFPGLDAYSNYAANATTSFGAWRGRSVNGAVVWPNRGSWASFTQLNALYINWAKQPYTKVITLPLFPANVGDTVGACVAGAYNGYWRTFATTMNSAGLSGQGTVIRLGWEMNLHSDWGTPSQFAACWRDIVSTVRPIAPGLLWDWNVNRGSSSGMPGASVLQAYPGNSYVDIVGVDSYDFWPPATAAGGWQTQLNGAYGLNYWLNFASAHGKQFSVPEWGLMPTASDGGGDDPGYISDMYHFFLANSKEMAFESYFNDAGSSIYDPDRNRNSASEYWTLWST